MKYIVIIFLIIIGLISSGFYEPKSYKVYLLDDMCQCIDSFKADSYSYSTGGIVSFECNGKCVSYVNARLIIEEE